MTPEYENVLVERRQVVLWVCINRPKRRNALSRTTLVEIGAACAGAAQDPELRAVVITGQGREAFAAGGDLKELAAVRSAEQAGALFDIASGALDTVRSCPVPVIASLNGVALGGGAELAMACDFRIAARHAAIGYIHARLAISSGFGGAADLTRVLGPGPALYHALSGEAIEASQAHAIGLVDEVAGENETLDQCTARFLAPILARTPLVVRAWKAMALAGRRSVHDGERRAVERSWFVTTWTHDDHWSAVDRLSRTSREKDA